MIRSFEQAIVEKQRLRNFTYDHSHDRHLFDTYVEEPTPKSLRELYESKLAMAERIVELHRIIVEDDGTYQSIYKLNEEVKSLTQENVVLQLLLHVLDKKLSHMAGIYARTLKDRDGATEKTRVVLEEFFKSTGYDHCVIAMAFDKDQEDVRQAHLHLIK
jgi:hypothetical protein